MARQRVNKRFLMMLVGGLILLGGFGWGLWHGKMQQRDPAPYMAAGDGFYVQKEYDKAVAQYRRAKMWAARKGDTQTQIKAMVRISEALPHIETEQAVGRAMGELEQAVTKDPHSILAQRARLEMYHTMIQDRRNPRDLPFWQKLQEYADELIDVLNSSDKENLNEDKARAHYLRGLAVSISLGMQQDLIPLEVLETKQEELVFFAKAHAYDPDSVAYGQALALAHLDIGRQFLATYGILSKEQRQLVIEKWYEARKIVKQLSGQQPNSGAALILLAVPLQQTRILIRHDQLNKVSEDAQISSGLSEQELVDAYLKAWADDSARPTLTEVNSAIDRLTEEYLQEAEKLGTDTIEVQKAKARYWLNPGRRDLNKVRASLEKAAQAESDIIAKLELYLQIADMHKREGQGRKALDICEQALDILDLPADLRIVRAAVLRRMIYVLHHFAAQNLVDMSTEFRGSDASDSEEVNTLLDRAEEHLKVGLVISGLGDKGNYKTLILRGKIAQFRRPEMDEKDLRVFLRTRNRKAVQLYEQARDELENMNAGSERTMVLQYSNLLIRLAQTYDLDGQSGAAEKTLSKALNTLQAMVLDGRASAIIGPATKLFLAELQLKNRHISEAQETLDELADQLSADQGELDAAGVKWMGELLKKRARQFELQGNSRKALSTLQQIEEQYPDIANWALARQFRLHMANPDSSLEAEVVLKRWMALQPDSSNPVVYLVALYVSLNQHEKAQALKEKAVVNHPEWEPVLSQAMVFDKKVDRDARRQKIKEAILKDNDDPLGQLLKLSYLYQQDYVYYNGIAIKHTREGKTDLAEKARKQSLQNKDLFVQSLEQAYEMKANDSRVHQKLLGWYLMDGNWDKAEKIVARATEENWDGLNGLFFKGRLHLAKGESLAGEDEQAANKEYQEALTYLEQTVQMREKFSQGWAAKASAEHHLGHYEAALESAQTAVEQDPTNVMSVQLLLRMTAAQWDRARIGENATQTRDFAEKTYKLAQRALELNPNNRRAKTFEMAYLDEYDRDKAIILRVALLEKDPSDRNNLQKLITLYQKEKKTKQIIQTLEDLVAKQPDSLELVLLLAGRYNRDKRYDESLQLLQPALQRWPDRLSVAMALIVTYRLNNEPQKAAICLQELLSKTKEEEKGQLYRAVGSLEAGFGRHKEAVDAFQRAIANVKQYHGEDLKTICDLSWLMFNSGAQQEAIDTVLPLAKKEDLYAIRMLVDFYLRSLEPAQGIKWAQQGLSISPESLDQKIALAAALLAGNKPAEAQELLEKEIKEIGRGNKAANVYTLLAKAYSMQQQYETGRLLLEQAVNSGVTQPKVRLELTTFYRFTGEVDKAARQYQLILERQPRNRKVRQLLVDLWIDQSRYAHAHDRLMEGRELEPDDFYWPSQLSKLWLRRTGESAEERNRKALSYALEAATKSGNNLASVVDVMMVLNLQRKHARCVDFYESTVPEAHKHNYRVLLQLAGAKRGQWRQGKFASNPMSAQELEQLRLATMALYHQSLSSSEGNRSVYLMVARGLASMAGIDEAVKSHEILASKNPGDAQNQIMLSMLVTFRAQKLKAMNQGAQAKAELNRAVSLLQSVVQQSNLGVTMRLTAEQQLASIYGGMEMYAQAAEMYIKVLSASPNDAVSLNNLAYLLADSLGKPEEALGYIERAMRQFPQNFNLLDTYAWILFKAGQLDRALERMQQSVSIRPTGIGYYHLGVILKQRGDNLQALQALRKAEKLLEQEAIQDEQIKAKVRALIEELEQE